MDDQREPFADVILLPGGGFSIPELKWRELLFVRALVPQGEHYVRDPRRPLPPFERGGLFPEGSRFRAERRSGRVELRPEAGPEPRL